MKQFKLIIAALLVTLTFSSCVSLNPFSKGKVALINGRAVAPSNAPAAVKRAVAAGNALQRKPYRMGGGHANHNDYAYDCSGSVSYVLRNAGLMRGSMPSRGFKKYG